MPCRGTKRKGDGFFACLVRSLSQLGRLRKGTKSARGKIRSCTELAKERTQAIIFGELKPWKGKVLGHCFGNCIIFEH